MSELEAGRELDALVATEVMRWIGVVPEHVDPTARWFVWSGKPSLPEKRVEIPRYSTDIAAAWTIIEKLRGHQMYLDVDTCTKGYSVNAGWEGPPNGDIWETCHASADTAPLAICRCALATLHSLAEQSKP